jgi:hypothetical protein
VACVPMTADQFLSTVADCCRWRSANCRLVLDIGAGKAHTNTGRGREMKDWRQACQCHVVVVTHDLLLHCFVCR